MLYILKTLFFAMVQHQLPTQNDPRRDMSWEESAANKRVQIDAKIPQDWRLDPETIKKARNERSIAGNFIRGLLDYETLAITELDNVDLVGAMAEGSLTAVEVTTAFCKRAVYAHQLVRGLLP